MYDANDADEESLKAEIQRLVELTKAKGISAVATELKISRGTLISWIEEWHSPSKRNLEKIRNYLQTRETSSTDTIGAERRAESGELFVPDKDPAGELGKQPATPETGN